MAVAFEVVGPYSVGISAPDDGANSYTILGYTPNNERPSFEHIMHTEELGSTEYGDEAEQVIYTGSRGILQFSLAKWDETIFDDLMTKIIPKQTGTSALEGQYGAGDIGSLLVSSTKALSFLFGVKFTPVGTNAGLAIRTFPSCYIEGSAIRQFDFGNTGTRLSITCQVRRSIATALVPAGSAPLSTDELMVKGVTS